MKHLLNNLAILSFLSIQTVFAVETENKKLKEHAPHDEKEHNHSEHEHKGESKSKDQHDHSDIERKDKANSKDEHAHPEHEQKDETRAKDDHGHEHGHEEERANVGPNKGVLEADEQQGFKLNQNAEKNFSIQSIPISKSGTLVVPMQALLFSGMEKQIFRNRGGYWKAVDIKIIKRNSHEATIESKDLTKGDDIAVAGVGFLKIVEQSVFGPAIEGHVH